MSMGYLDIAHKNKPRNFKDIHVSLCFFGLILSPTIINLSSTGCQKKNVRFGNTKKQGLLGQAKFEKINNKHAIFVRLQSETMKNVKRYLGEA